MIRTSKTQAKLAAIPAIVDDIADAVSFLSSERARFITGQTLVVDGGWTMS